MITENNSQPDALVIDSKTKWISFHIIFPLSINFHAPLCAIYQPCKIKKETVKNKQVWIVHNQLCTIHMNMIIIFTLNRFIPKDSNFIQWSERFMDYNHFGIDFLSLFREIFYLECTYEQN